jgi:hypothetical protein
MMLIWMAAHAPLSSPSVCELARRVEEKMIQLVGQVLCRHDRANP